MNEKNTKASIKELEIMAAMLGQNPDDLMMKIATLAYEQGWKTAMGMQKSA